MLYEVITELVAQTLALGGARHQAGDVDELDDRGNHLLPISNRSRVLCCLNTVHISLGLFVPDLFNKLRFIYVT